MTNSYQGPATVLIDGAQIPAEVDLTISVQHTTVGGDVLDTLKSWDGTLDADPGVDWFSSPTAGQATLRMPDGREGTFLPTSGSLGSGRVEIQGTGPAPFGDD